MELLQIFWEGASYSVYFILFPFVLQRDVFLKVWAAAVWSLRKDEMKAAFQ